MHFQWYPGHMTKAKRMMQENIKLIDLVIELVDARIPVSSRNPDIDELGKNKARLILLNKSDLAEEKQNDAWAEYFKEKGFSVVKVNSKRGGGIKSIQGVIQEACKEKIERDRKRGILIVRCGQWLSGFQMSESRHLSMLLQAKHARRLEISQGSQKENSGSVLIKT